jgi:hypothetical protein
MISDTDSYFLVCVSFTLFQEIPLFHCDHTDPKIRIRSLLARLTDGTDYGTTRGHPNESEYTVVKVDVCSFQTPSLHPLTCSLVLQQHRRLPLGARKHQHPLPARHRRLQHRQRRHRRRPPGDPPRPRLGPRRFPRLPQHLRHHGRDLLPKPRLLPALHPRRLNALLVPPDVG